jgi:hypothetical protein
MTVFLSFFGEQSIGGQGGYQSLYILGILGGIVGIIVLGLEMFLCLGEDLTYFP